MKSALNGPSLQHYIMKRLSIIMGRISLLERYEKQYNWKGFEFPVLTKKIKKFENSNPGMAVNVLFNNKKNQKKYI